jgi:hypothetical protein
MGKRAIILSLLFLLYLFIPNNALAVKLTIPATHAYKGEEVEIPVNMDHGEALAGFQMTVTYDFSALRASDVTSGDLSPVLSWVILRDTDTPGQITIVAYNPSLAEPSRTSGSLANLLFYVIGGQQGSDINIDISNVLLSNIYGNEIPSIATSGLIHINIVDNDVDGIPDDIDICPEVYNPNQTDTDEDGIGDECGERCVSTLPVKLGSNYYASLQDAYDAAVDGDTIFIQSEILYQNLVANLDKSVTIDGGYNCNFSDYDAEVPYTTLKGEIINDSPSSLTLKNISVARYYYNPIDCSNPPDPPLVDVDSDGIEDACDACPTVDPSCDPATVDTDNDGMPDSFEIQYELNRSDPFDSGLDPDGDGLTNLEEFESGGNPRDTDKDGDGIPDVNDKCPDVPNDDADDDGDGIPDACDNCVSTFNSDQANADNDDEGDACDACTDTDDDTYGNPGFQANTCPDDNCPYIANPAQEDTDGNDIGDMCDYNMWYDEDWLNRQKVVIDESITASDLEGFPLLVKITGANGVFSRALSNGDDIVFTASDGVRKLSHEIEKFETAAGNEELVAWVKVPELSSAANTVVYMYYGNSIAVNQEDANGVWDENYRGVWHLNEDYLDSTQYGKNLLEKTGSTGTDD